MNFFRLCSILYASLMTGCVGNWNPNGPKSNRPYFITKQPIVVKKLVVPVGTKLTYEGHFFKKGEQRSMMSEEKLTDINLPEGKTIDWGGVPVRLIYKFANSKMKGFTVCADFNEFKPKKKTAFSELWESCNDRLSITVQSTSDWSFNIKNIFDVESCGVNYQRYFKEDVEQQNFLDSIFAELKKVQITQNH